MSLSCPALRAPARRLCGLTTFQRRLNSSDPLKSLADKFRDPSTPYYIAPGTRGPASEDDHQSSSSSSTSKHDASLTLADQHARQHGYDVGTRILVPVAWGEQDMFRHVNNVHFGRYFESARMRVMEQSARYVSPQTLRDLLTGTNTGLVVKSVKIDYKRPVTYPDTLAIYTTPCNINQERASFGLKYDAFSLTQDAVVAKCESVQVMYDFSSLKKGKMSDEIKYWLDAATPSM